MSVLCLKPAYKYRYMLEGWRSVFEAAGVQFIVWEPSEKPAFDAFDEVNPDYFLWTYDFDNPALEKRVTLAGRRIKHLDAKNPIAALDTFRYTQGNSKNELKCDIAYVGSYSPEKLEAISPFFSKYNVKIMGDTPWPVPQYIGRGTPTSVCNLYASARVCLHLGEGNSERPFQILGAGGFPVGDDVGMGFPTLEDIDDYVCTSASERMKMEDMVVQAKSSILKCNTYFHVVADMLIRANAPNQAAMVMGVYNAHQGL